MLIEHPVGDRAALRLVTAGPVIVSCFLRPPRASMIAEIAQVQGELIKVHPAIFSMAIIPRFVTAGRTQDTQAVLPSVEERSASIRRAVQVADTFGPHVAASAVVVLAGGLIAVFVRSFVAAYSLVSRPAGPTGTFRSIDEAVAWARQQPRVPVLPPGLERAVERWVAELAAHQPRAAGS